MVDVLISEFIDNDAVSSLKKNFKVHYDPELWSKSKELMNLVSNSKSSLNNASYSESSIVGSSKEW